MALKNMRHIVHRFCRRCGFLQQCVATRYARVLGSDLLEPARGEPGSAAVRSSAATGWSDLPKTAKLGWYISHCKFKTEIWIRQKHKLFLDVSQQGTASCREQAEKREEFSIKKPKYAAATVHEGKLSQSLLRSVVCLLCSLILLNPVVANGTPFQGGLNYYFMQGIT